MKRFRWDLQSYISQVCEKSPPSGKEVNDLKVSTLAQKCKNPAFLMTPAAVIKIADPEAHGTLCFALLLVLALPFLVHTSRPNCCGKLNEVTCRLGIWQPSIGK